MRRHKVEKNISGGMWIVLPLAEAREMLEGHCQSLVNDEKKQGAVYCTPTE